MKGHASGWQPEAFQAAERRYLRAFRQLEVSGPQTWASSVMQAIQQTDVMMVFPQRGGKLMSSLEILPSVTACKCSQRASMAQFGW